MNKKHFLIFFLGLMSSAVIAQRHTDKLDRGLVAIPTGSTSGSTTNLVTWRRLSNEYYDVKYNLYKNGKEVASNLTTTCYADNSNGLPTTTYQVAAVVNGAVQEKCGAVTAWTQYVYKNGNNRYATAYLDIPLATVYDRDGNDVTSHYEPNDAEMADLDGDGQLEIIIKRLNTVDAKGYDSGLVDAKGNARWIIYPQNSREFVVLDAYDVDWQTGKATLLWRIDCGPNMVSANSTEINIIAYDWDEDGKAEVVLRGADNMIVYGNDGKKQLFTIGNMSVNTRPVWYTSNEKGSSTANLAYTSTGSEYLIYMNGETGEKYQVTDYPLTRESASAWGDGSGHRSSKYFFGAPFLDGRKASLFLGRGIYTRHKMIAMNLNSKNHTWSTLWTWNCNDSSSPWYGNGYHNYIIADVDEDGRDEIVYGSMVIDDNGMGLSTTGLGHGDAQHVGDFDPYRKGLEFFGCNEDKPAMNYRNATTSELYIRRTADDDDGRALMDNFSNNYPGSQGRSVSTGLFSSVTDKEIDGLTIDWGDLNFRIYWDGDLCSEILNSPGTAKEAKVEKPGTGRLFTSSGCNMNNDSKNNPCFQGDIIGDWREEIVVRCGGNLRVYTSGIYTSYSLPMLWNDHQYRQAMVWQMMAYNQPPHLSYFLGEMEGITVAPPTLTNDGRTEVANGETITTTTDHLLMCETNNMSVSVEDGASPYLLTVNTPSWVQGHDNNNNITTETFIHTLTGGAFTGKMRLIKQGNGILELPNVTETYTGETSVWAGTLRFNGTMEKSPVWLNRHTTLETDGGVFTESITADYGSTIAVGSGGITVGTLTLNHGARLKVGIDADGTVTPINATKIVLNKKSGDAWEQYGPQYLKPVIEFTLDGTLGDGVYIIGDVGEVMGDMEQAVVLEGLDGVANPRLMAESGKLCLVVGTGESVDCPEATFAVGGYQQTADGLLPVVSINPGTFSYGGSEVTPTISATFNGETVNLTTLYSEDYEESSDVSSWTNGGGDLELATDNGKYVRHNIPNSTNNRSAYSLFDGINFTSITSYAIEFDAALTAGIDTRNTTASNTDFVVMSKGAVIPTKINVGYGYNASKCNAPGCNYLFRLNSSGTGNQTFIINESEATVTLLPSTWYHYSIDIDIVTKTATYTIIGNNGIMATGFFDLPEGTSCEAYGLFILDGRYGGNTCIDNIRIYRTDGYYVTVTEPGTLEVTTSYPGCQSATSSYMVTMLDELSTTAPEMADVNYVSVKRTLKAGEWSTVCLPFSMNSEQLSTAFGSDFRVAEFTGYNKSEGVISINFTDVTAMEANHPYIIKVTKDMTRFGVSDVAINPQNPVSSPSLNASFVGTYTASTIIPVGGLYLSSNKFWYSTGNSQSKAFRAYFDLDDKLANLDASRIVMSFGDGTVTGIADNERNYGEDWLFDLQGRRIKKTPGQGVYIRQGKKLLMK